MATYVYVDSHTRAMYSMLKAIPAPEWQTGAGSLTTCVSKLIFE